MTESSVRAVICAVVTATTLTGQSVAVRLPDESEGIGGLARALVSAFDQVDVVALGEDHGRTLDSDLRLAIVRHPDCPHKVRSIVVEFGSTTEQVTLDRDETRILPDYQKFDRVLKTQTRPVLVPLSREPFGGFSAEEFIGGQLITCSGGGCRSVFNDSPLTLRNIADAAVYVGDGNQADPRAK